MGNQTPQVEEGETTQWPKENGQNDKQRATKQWPKEKGQNDKQRATKQWPKEKGQNDKQRATKHYTENQRSSNKNHLKFGSELFRYDIFKWSYHFFIFFFQDTFYFLLNC